MKAGKKHRGSITIFALLTLPLVTGCLLSLLEGSRYWEIRQIADIRSHAAVESGFANYQEELWNTYRLLGAVKDEMMGIICECAEGADEDSGPGVNFFRTDLQDVEPVRYTLLTDGNGVAYINSVSAYMQRNITYETAKFLFAQYQDMQQMLDSADKEDSAVDDALRELDNLKKQTSKGSSAVRQSRKKDTDNPLGQIERLQKTQLLELVIEDTSVLSENSYETSQMVSKRELQQGKEYRLKETGWMDRVFLQQYLLAYFSNYKNPAEDRGYAYELEYLIGGKSSDIENLRVVAEELLLVRESANMAYLLTDSEKCEEAQLLATLLAAATENPAVIEVVKYGLLAAWAFAESVLDVRGLLQGKRIAIVKTAKDWTLALSNIGSISEHYITAKDCEGGLTYRDYLGALLLLQTDKKLAYRAMDVQEMTLNKIYDVKMDEIVVNATVEMTYRYKSVFAAMGDGQIVTSTEYSYH